jgi:hypothetical protein
MRRAVRGRGQKSIERREKMKWGSDEVIRRD